MQMYILEKRNLWDYAEQHDEVRCQQTSYGEGWAGKKTQMKECGTIKCKEDCWP